MDTLPRDMHLYILRFVDRPDIQWRVRFLSRYWKTLSLESYLWECKVRMLPEKQDVSRYRVVPSRQAEPEVKSWEWLYRALTHEITTDAPNQVGYLNHGRIRQLGTFTNRVLHGFGIEERPMSLSISNWDCGFRKGYTRSEIYLGNSKVNTYEGEVAIDKEGHGIYTWSNGASYEGEYKNDEINGFGRYNGPDDFVYVGKFDHARYDQIGFCVSRASYYMGEYKTDSRDGKGYLYFPDGALYCGDWVADRRHGQGYARDCDGNEYVGEWRDDHPVDPSFTCHWNGVFNLFREELLAYIRKIMHHIYL